MKLRDRLGLCWRILRAEPGNLMDHALRELPDSTFDEMQMLMNRQLQEMILVFTTHGHSGFSASYAISALEKLLRYKPLGPLTGEPAEWREIGEGVFQNRRCSHVFRRADVFDGQAYDMHGRVFREPNGACYTSRESFVPITFPYTPTTEYVEVSNG